MKNAPYLDFVTINRRQLELYADNLIVKLGKRNAWEATTRLFIEYVVLVRGHCGIEYPETVSPPIYINMGYCIEAVCPTIHSMTLC